VTDRDRELARLAAIELDWDPRLDASGVHVRAEEGIVFLRGKVRTLAEKHAATGAAVRAAGVVHVWNGLEIDVSRVRGPSDGELRRAVLGALRSEPHVPNGVVAVDVRKGYVRLHGALEFPLEIAAAEAAVRRVSGVRGLSSELCLRRGRAVSSAR